MKELLTHATTWMNLENIILSDRGQTQKTVYCVSDSIYMKCLEKANLQKQKQLCGCLGLELGSMMPVNGHEETF